MASRLARFLSTAPQTALERAILDAARTKQTGVSMLTLLQFGKQASEAGLSETLIQSATFLKRELPIRYAHRIVELDNLPHGLNSMPSIKRVSAWYRQSFDQIRSCPDPVDAMSEQRFTDLLGEIYQRHNPTLVTMARGIHEFRRSLGVAPGHPLPAVIEADVHQFLDLFFTSRVGIRTLMSQHIAMHSPRSHYIGIISTQCQPGAIIRDAIEDARLVCERNYGESPDVHIYGDKDFVFSYVPQFLHHVMFEILKNSMRAVVEAHGSAAKAKGRDRDSLFGRTGALSSPIAPTSAQLSETLAAPKNGAAQDDKMPPIRVILSASSDSEDVTIKIADEGQGIPRSGMRRLFSYFFSTAAPKFREGDDEDTSGDFTTEMPMAGLGVGLPLSRVYARYFGGDLQVISMEGYGTDAYVFLRRLGDAAEPLSECAHGSRLSELARGLAEGVISPRNNVGATAIRGVSVDDLHSQAFPQTAQPPHASFRISMKMSPRHPAGTTTGTPPTGGSVGEGSKRGMATAAGAASSAAAAALAGAATAAPKSGAARDGAETRADKLPA